MNKNRLILLLAIIVLLVSGCSKKNNKESGESANNKKNLSTVIVADVETKQMTRTITLSGKAEGILDIDMLADISGRLISLNKHLGDYVNKGEEIGRIESDQYEYAMKQAEASLLASETSLVTKRMQLSADSLLFKQQSISEQALLLSKNAYQAALASYKGAQAQYEQAERMFNRAVLKAPASGYISYLPIKVGENINANSVVCSIVDDQTIIVRTGIGQNYVHFVDVGDDVNISCNGNTIPTVGKVERIGRSAKIGDSLYPIEIKFKNPGRMLSGMIINLEINKKTSDDKVAIKFDKVEQRYDQNYVYVVKGDKVYEQQVTLGEMINDFVIITSGLNPGDKIVADSMGKLSDGQQVIVKSNS